MARRSLGEWLSDRWHARRYDAARMAGYPRWWRARELRRLAVGAPRFHVHVDADVDAVKVRNEATKGNLARAWYDSRKPRRRVIGSDGASRPEKGQP